ncbi:MAG: hypothetical protein ACOYNS_05215 [Bacteroidota bacterium]
MKKSSLLIFLLSLFLIVSAQQKPILKTQPVKVVEKPADAPSGKIIGSLFSDYSYFFYRPQPLSPSATFSGENDFSLRRASIGYEYSYNKNVTAVVEYDANSNVLIQGNVDLKNIVPMMDLKLGLMQTLSSEIVDRIWEYRSLEASVLDRRGYTHEFDKGLALTGKMNSQGTTYLRFAAYNGNGIAAENNKMKKLAVVVGSWLDKSSAIEAYVDYENLNGGKSTITGKVFYGMVSSTMGFGAEAFYRLERKQNVLNGNNVNPVGLSLYSWFELMRSLRFVVRVDGADNDLAESNIGHREVFVNGGFDYMPVPDVHLIPNIVYVKNLKKGNTPDIADRIELRLTTAVTIK